MSQIPILYEDNHLLVVVKPPNLLSQGDQTGDDDLHSLLKEYIREKYNKPGNVYLGLVHRLDRPTGGVMVFAKTSKAAGRLSEQLRDNTLQRSYLTIVSGYPEPLQGERRDYLLKDNRTNMVSVVKPNVAGAQEAILKYQVLDMKNGFSLVRVQLLTGRPHQIRVQMAAFGHPVLGDQRYGPRTNVRQQLALWAERISLVHPTKKERLEFSEPPPKEKPWTDFRLP
ncbi:MAG: RluA family pseudouridine synthase [Firmicutes bacterium]|jgi:23S rRNA pseudouridine1911/1915/1917 synthase|nr:RluA family pseudouridine synthase [Bacillota bacterium]NLO66378.1 RluA family pseudouridine synthase [Bacillota bacterium]